MKKLVSLGLIVVGVVSSMAGAAPSSGDANAISMKVSGDGDWSVWCDLNEGSDSTTRFLDSGRSDYSSQKLRSAACRFKTSRRGPMTVVIEGAAWKCPFPETGAGKCEKVFAKATFGSFDLKRK